MKDVDLSDQMQIQVHSAAINIVLGDVEHLLYSSDQLFGHASQQFFSDPGFNFFSIYGDFGELSEILNGHVREELVGTVQYFQFICYVQGEHNCSTQWGLASGII